MRKILFLTKRFKLVLQVSFWVFISGCAMDYGNHDSHKLVSKAEISALEDLLKKDVNDRKTEDNLIVAYINNKDYERARNMLVKLIADNENDTMAEYLMGLVCSRQGANDESRIYYNKVLELNPNHIPSLFNLAVVEQNNGHLEKSKNLYRKILDINPNDADAHYNLAILYDKKIFDVKKAIYHYDKCIQLYSGNTAKKNLVKSINLRLKELNLVDKKTDGQN